MGKEPLYNEKPLPSFAHCKCFHNTQVIHIGPCLVCAVTISGKGAAGSCDIYDGRNANMELKSHLEVLTGTTFGLDLERPTDFDHGIYLAVGEITTYVTIQWIPEDWHHFF